MTFKILIFNMSLSKSVKLYSLHAYESKAKFCMKDSFNI